MNSSSRTKPRKSFRPGWMGLRLCLMILSLTLSTQGASPTREQIEGFWQKTLSRLEQQPMEAVLERVPHSEEAIPYHKFRVTFSSLDGIRVQAYLSYPVQGEFDDDAWRLDQAVQALPAIVSAPGYGGLEQGVELADCQRGYVILQVFPRSQGPSAELWKINGPDKISWGIDNPEGFYYQGAYADMIRGIDYLVSRPDVDADRIGLMGSCQGGGIVLAVGSLDPRIKAVVAHVPNLIDMRRTVHLEGSLVNRVTMRGPVLPKHLDTLDYFDALNLVRDLRAPTLVSAGGKDKVSPAEAVRAVFDQMAGVKSLVYYPELPHTTALSFYEMGWNWIDLYLRR